MVVIIKDRTPGRVYYEAKEGEGGRDSHMMWFMTSLYDDDEGKRDNSNSA